MKVKTCFKCSIEKPLTDFYKHSKMKYGCINKCKICARKDSEAYYDKNMLNPEFKEKERIRSKVKHNDLACKINREKYPEKYRARIISQRVKPIVKTNILHHWSYRVEHAKDVIEITRDLHYKIHKYLVYDQERCMYRNYHTNILLDTKEAHLEFIKYIDATF